MSEDVQYVVREGGVPITGIRIGGSFWERVWFLISAAPHYLLTGMVRLPGRERPIT